MCFVHYKELQSVGNELILQFIINCCKLFACSDTESQHLLMSG